MWNVVLSLALILAGPTAQLPQPQSAVLFGDDNVSKDVERCEDGKVIWSGDGKCYTPGERGPCAESQTLIFSKEDFSAKCSPALEGVEEPPFESVTAAKNCDKKTASNDDLGCNKDGLVLWGEDGACYELLTQGPCQDSSQWLVLESQNPPRAKCVEKPCADNRRQAFWPQLCQCVDINQDVKSGRYTPLELCGPGSRLVWSPYGEGLCTCDTGFLMDSQGKCLELGTQGPCAAEQIWDLVEGVLECRNSNQAVKVRITDLIYQNDDKAQVVRCYMDSKGKCRRPLGSTDSVAPRIDLSEFEAWLASFTKQAESAVCQTAKCEDDQMLWIDGTCHQIGSTGPCPPGSWLILQNLIDDRPVLRCEKRRCEEGVWWTQSCSCVHSSPTVTKGKTGLEPSPCADNQELVLTPYGNGICLQPAQDAINLQSSEPRQDIPTFHPATRANCPTIENGACAAGINKSGAAADLISWLHQFDNKAGSCALASEAELQCYEEQKVPYKDKCYSLLSSEPCAEAEWLVMRKEDDRLVATCQARPCPTDQIFLENDCKCHEARGDVCGENEELFVDVFGRGTCQCKPLHLLYSRDNICYVLPRGPCDDDAIFVASADGYGTCVRSECPPDQIFVPQEEVPEGLANSNSSRCFALGAQGPCKDGQLVGISADSLSGSCVAAPIGTRIFDLITSAGSQGDDDNSVKLLSINCNLDARGRCRRPLRPFSNRRTRRASPTAHRFGSWLESFLALAPTKKAC